MCNVPVQIYIFFIEVLPTRREIAVPLQERSSRPGHTGLDNENDNENDKNAGPQLVMVQAEYAHAHSTNRGRAFLSFSFSFSLSGPV